MTGKPIASGRGRKKKPNSKKKISGSKHVAPDEPQFTQIVEVSPPEWLDELATGMWKTITDQLCREKILAVTDLHNVEVFCSAYSNWREAQREVSLGGVTLSDDSGKKYKNPAMTALNESARQLATFGGLLGLDPSSRQRLTGGNKSEKDNRFLDY